MIGLLCYSILMEINIGGSGITQKNPIMPFRDSGNCIFVAPRFLGNSLVERA